MTEILIRPPSTLKLLDIAEIWRYRELLYIFVWRDLKVRYKQTVLGIVWVIFQPLVSTFIFTFFFGNLAKISSGSLPYSLFVLTGLVFWLFFSTTLTYASTSMIDNAHIIRKVYFPKIVLPLASMLTAFADFSVASIMLFLYAVVGGYIPTIYMLIVFPAAVFVCMLTSAGLGFFLASINVKYRDVRYILPFFIQLLLFVTPIIYPLSIVSDRNRLILAINPMTLVIESVRSAFPGGNPVHSDVAAISLVSAVMIFLFGLWYFKRTEQFFADIV